MMFGHLEDPLLVSYLHYNFMTACGGRIFVQLHYFYPLSDPTKRDLIALYNEAMDNGGFETEVR